MIVQSRLCLPGNCLLRPMQQTKIKNWIASIEDQFQDEEIQHKLPHTYAIRTIGNGLYLIFPNVGVSKQKKNYYVGDREISSDRNQPSHLCRSLTRPEGLKEEGDDDNSFSLLKFPNQRDGICRSIVFTGDV